MIVKKINPKANCTHLYDLTLLALQHSLRNEEERIYDIDIPDEDADKMKTVGKAREYVKSHAQ